MSDYTWSPPSHPDPPDDQPLGIPAAAGATPVDHDPVWARVDFTRTGPQRSPGFVDADGGDRVLVQLMHMGNSHRVWLPRSQVTRRQLRAHRSGNVGGGR